MLRRMVVDLQSTAPHMKLPDSVAATMRERTPDGWELVLIKSPTVSAGDGTNRVSDETLTAMATAECYFGFGVPAALINASPNLRWAHSASAGVGSSITPELRASGVTLTNSAGVYAEAMADSVLAGVLYFVRGLDYAVAQQRDALWDQTPFVTATARMRETATLRVLVIGAGGIGSAVANRFAALGARCVGIRRRPELGVPSGFHEVYGTDAVDAELTRADVVVLSAPLTESSRMLLNKERLSLLAEGAVVVNVARGALLDHESLLGGLNSGRLRGAVLDVFLQEPLPTNSELWRHPRVLVTPHITGVSPQHWDRSLHLFLENWRRWVNKEPLINTVNLDSGY